MRAVVLEEAEGGGEDEGEGEDNNSRDPGEIVRLVMRHGLLPARLGRHGEDDADRDHEDGGEMPKVVLLAHDLADDEGDEEGGGAEDHVDGLGDVELEGDVIQDGDDPEDEREEHVVLEGRAVGDAH